MSQNPDSPERESDTDSSMHKERGTKDDGRYIIFYTFDGEPEPEKS